jgi:hypothetical protein
MSTTGGQVRTDAAGGARQPENISGEMHVKDIDSNVLRLDQGKSYRWAAAIRLQHIIGLPHAKYGADVVPNQPVLVQTVSAVARVEAPRDCVRGINIHTDWRSSSSTSV